MASWEDAYPISGSAEVWLAVRGFFEGPAGFWRSAEDSRTCVERTRDLWQSRIAFRDGQIYADEPNPRASLAHAIAAAGVAFADPALDAAFDAVRELPPGTTAKARADLAAHLARKLVAP